MKLNFISPLVKEEQVLGVYGDIRRSVEDLIYEAMYCGLPQDEFHYRKRDILSLYDSMETLLRFVHDECEFHEFADLIMDDTSRAIGWL